MELGAERASFRAFQERWQAMKPKKLLEKLDEFGYWLKEFERQRRSLLGAPITRSGNDELMSQRQQVHHALDDFRLTLLRKYHSLRPFIATYSQCFTFVSEDGKHPLETYEALIERGVNDFRLVYDDLSQIKDNLSEYDPETKLDTRGCPIVEPGV
jgi:hypothetical protein